MNDYQRLLLPICGGLLALSLLLKCGERKGRLRHLLSLVIVLAALAFIYLGKDEKAIWIPTLAALLVAAAQEVLKWQPADKPAVSNNLSIEKFTEILQEEHRRFFLEEQKRQAVEAKLTDIEKSYAEKLRLLEETNGKLEQILTLEQLKCGPLEMQIEKARASLLNGDSTEAEQVFDAVAEDAGRAAAAAAFQSGKLAEDRLDYDKAMRQYRKAAALEKDNPDYLLAAGKMARKLAEYKQAQEWLERLLELREAEGKNDAALGDALHELALLHKDMGQYTAAEPLHLRAVAVKEQDLGKEHPDVAEVLNDLAALYWREGKYAEAEPLYLRALAVQEQTVGKDHLSVAQTLNDLGILYSEQGRFAEAESLYLRSFAIRKNNLDEEHIDLSESMNNLANLYRKQDRYAEAEALHLRSLAVREKILGKNHPHVARTINNLAFLYRQQDKYEKAEPMYLRSLAIREQVLGKEHPDVANSLHNIAGLYWAQGRYEEAERLLHRALQIREDKLGKDHTDVATTLRTLAKLYCDQGRYAEAEPLFQRALSILQAKLPAGHSRISGCQKDYDEMKEKMAGM